MGFGPLLHFMAASSVAYPLPLDYVASRPAFALFLPFDVLDGQGRPLMENRTIRHRSATSEPVVCPYADYRRDSGKPMNAAALAAFNRLGVRTLDLLGLHASCVRETRPIERADVLQLWRISKLAVSAVARFGVRQVLSTPGVAGIDAASGAVYKVARGLVSLFEELASAQGSLAECSLDSIVAFVENRQLLEGPREVCAAPLPLIRRVISHLLHTATTSPPAPACARTALHYAALLSMAERACFACQVVRNALHPSPALPVRHTFAAARDAARVGQGGTQMALEALKSVERLHWSEDNADGEAALARLVADGSSLIQAPASNRQAAWLEFRQIAVLVLERVNSEVAVLEGSRDVRSLAVKDFDLFFGPHPLLA